MEPVATAAVPEPAAREAATAEADVVPAPEAPLELDRDRPDRALIVPEALLDAADDPGFDAESLLAAEVSDPSSAAPANEDPEPEADIEECEVDAALDALEAHDEADASGEVLIEDAGLVEDEPFSPEDAADSEADAAEDAAADAAEDAAGFNLGEALAETDDDPTGSGSFDLGGALDDEQEEASPASDASRAAEDEDEEEEEDLDALFDRIQV